MNSSDEWLTKTKELTPELMGLKLLNIARPVVGEFFRLLHDVDGNHLYSSIVGMKSEEEVFKKDDEDDEWTLW